MRKIHEILRLHFDLRLSQRTIATAASVSQSTVHQCLTRFTAAGLTWPLDGSLAGTALESRLYPPPPAPAARPLPDFAVIHRELAANKHVTLQLLWEERRAEDPTGLGYSRFCHHYAHWLDRQDIVMRQQHKAGEKLFVDWAGAKIPITDPVTGAVHMASLFVATLGASSYCYVEATWTQDTGDWIRAHVHALEFLGGAPELLVPDNLKTGVAKSCRYEPELNPVYQEMAEHYGMGVIPARVRMPRDKSKVEVSVQVSQRWIVAVLRKRQFFSLSELNEAIAELRGALNSRPFRKRPGSRATLFAELDRPSLRALPGERFAVRGWTKAKVNIDHHVQFGHSFYSVPYQLARRDVEVRDTADTVEIYCDGKRVASHVRASQANSCATVTTHRPKSHQAHLEWPPSRLIQWASETGPATAEMVERIMESKPHPEMGYRACLGLLRLSKRYGPGRMEEAAAYALRAGLRGYRRVKSVLETGIDLVAASTVMPGAPAATGHANVRGEQYYR